MKLFSATNELVSTAVLMPGDWDADQDVQLVLMWSLSQGETTLDVLSVTVDYVTIAENTTGASFAKTSTQLTPTVTVTPMTRNTRARSCSPPAMPLRASS